MPIYIKRYNNRKLYNMNSKKYITLEEIATLLKQGEEIKVIDNSTGSDSTAITLSQIIYEQQKKQSGFLPLSILSSLVQYGGYTIDSIRRNLVSSIDLSHHINDEIKKRVNILIEQNNFTQDEGNQIYQKLIEAGHHPSDRSPLLEEKFHGYLKAQGLPSKSDLQSLVEQIEVITEKVDELGRKDQSAQE